MRLTTIKIKKTKCPIDKKQFRLTDGAGLYLLLMNNGSKYWRLDYALFGVRKTLALGVFPVVSLQQARELAFEAKKKIAKGINPTSKKEISITFGQLYQEWLDRRKDSLSKKTHDGIQQRMKSINHLIANQKPEDVTPPFVLEILHRIEDKGNIHTAYKVRGIIGQVMRYGIATGRVTFDPTPSLRGALKPENTQSRPTILEPTKIGRLIYDIQNYKGPEPIKYGLLILIHTFPRPGELRFAEPHEFNLDTKVWTIPESRMKIKGRGDHLVPLSNQIIQYIQHLKNTNKKNPYMLPGQRLNRPLSENAFNSALRTIGYSGKEQTAHGFRATARSLLAEQGFPISAIERQLAHGENGRVAKAYARAEYLDLRREMMQKWSDYLDTL